MSREAIEQLVDLWIDDQTFRTQVRTDPEAAIRATGVELTEDEWAAVRAVDWSLSDEDLAARVSKLDTGACSSGSSA